jgi:hypothetical protein
MLGGFAERHETATQRVVCGVAPGGVTVLQQLAKAALGVWAAGRRNRKVHLRRRAFLEAWISRPI